MSWHLVFWTMAGLGALSALVAAVAVGLAVEQHLLYARKVQDEGLRHIHGALVALGKEIGQMAITQDDVKALAEATGKLVDITANALAAAAGDEAAKEQALADLQTLRTDVAWLNDAELDAKVDAMIAAAAAATPAPPDPPVE